MRASLATITACAIACGLAACGPGDGERSAASVTEQRLERLVPDLVDAVQAKHAAFVMEHVADEFSAEGLDYFGVRALVEGYAFREEEIGARLESVSITPEAAGEQRVAARVSFAVGQRLVETAELPPDATTYAIDVVFAKRGDKWLALRGSYRRE